MIKGPGPSSNCFLRMAYVAYCHLLQAGFWEQLWAGENKPDCSKKNRRGIEQLGLVTFKWQWHPGTFNVNIIETLNAVVKVAFLEVVRQNISLNSFSPLLPDPWEL